MDVNTEAIRRLRDALMTDSSDTAQPVDATEATLQRIEPFAETMFIVMAADDDLAAAEHSALNGAIHILAGGTTPTSQIDAMIDRFQNDLDIQGAEARLASIGTRFGTDREDREIAFTLAAAMALADEELDWRENRTLLWIQEYFGLSSRRIAALVESIE